MRYLQRKNARKEGDRKVALFALFLNGQVGAD